MYSVEAQLTLFKPRPFQKNMKGLKRYGIILVDKCSKKTLVLNRVNYALYNRLNNNYIPYVNANVDFFLSMYTGCNVNFEFPKGIRNMGESPFQCALREFFEETGIYLSTNSLVLDQVSYKYTSKNNKTYRCIYFIIDASFPNNYKSTDVLKMPRLPVLGDNFNILIYTKWKNIRNYFIKRQFVELVQKMDEVLT